MSDDRARAAVARAARPLGDGLLPVLERIADAEVVLLGEASHGTHEFYRIRAEITRRLIVAKGFAAVAVEADWPDAWRVGRWVLGTSDEKTAEEALGGFRRFPTWMWRNTDVVELLQWLRTHNESASAKAELNLGQLCRQRYGARCVNVGFTTYTGTVTASSSWDEPAQRKRVLDAMTGSYEALFHEIGQDAFMVFPGSDELKGVLGEPRLERAIGVIYRPETERSSHWFSCNLAAQFDAVIHVDATRALVPLEPGARWDHGEPPETYPTGI